VSSSRTPGQPGNPLGNDRAARSAGTVYRGRVVSSRPRGKKIALIAGAAVVALLLIVGIGGYWYASSLDSGIQRFGKLSSGGDRPTKTVSGAQNILLIGSDNADDQRGSQGVFGQRSDSLILMHIPASHDKAYLISFPRDLYVFVPSNGKGQGGHKAKINSAFAWGGIPLTVQTVENFTGVRIDHAVEIGFDGFKAMTDAVGGVDVYVERTTTDPRSKRTFKQGWNHLDGTTALDYVRQRYGLPNGDFDRVKRQQVFLKALLKKATSMGVVTDLGKLDKFLRATTKTLKVDDDFSVRDMAWQFKGLRTDDLIFVTTPNQGSQIVDGSSVVPADKEKALVLFSAVKDDKVGDWVATNETNPADKGR
jgi:LCP family protein required for cell wall assembly